MAITLSTDVYLSLLICSSPPRPLPKLTGPHQWVSLVGDCHGLPSLYLLTLTHQLPHCGNKLFLRAHPALAEVPSGVVHSLLETENHILRGGGLRAWKGKNTLPGWEFSSALRAAQTLTRRLGNFPRLPPTAAPRLRLSCRERCSSGGFASSATGRPLHSVPRRLAAITHWSSGTSLPPGSPSSRPPPPSAACWLPLSLCLTLSLPFSPSPIAAQ